VKTAYLNRREGEKRFRGVIWGQKLTLNHPSLVDEGEEIRVSTDSSQKREGKRGEGRFFRTKLVSLSILFDLILNHGGLNQLN